MKDSKVDAAVLFSGGKDSCLALQKAFDSGFNIKYLLTILPSSQDSYMYHKPIIKLLKTQYKILNIKPKPELIIQKSKSEKEKELSDLKKVLLLIKDKVNTLIIGGICSSYQGNRIKKIADSFGLKVYTPLWNYTTDSLWKELLEKKFKVIMTKIACQGLTEKWIGKAIDNKTYDELKSLSAKYGFDISFEGGDAETAVLDMPLFSKNINLEYDVKSEGQYRHFIHIKRMWLEDKC
jgi:ABC transporter with metal-binding/Fe-S-binding domain ATP-binding protein